MKTTKAARLALVGALAGAGALDAWAAGGHHAVDDAGILEAGQCELEGWASRALDGERLLHAGVNCRVGPVELGAAGEYARLSGASQTGWGVEAKWATAIRDGFSVGAKLGPAWASHVRPRYQGAALVGLATWQARDNVALHLNLGRDFVHRGEDEPRFGASLEWSPAKAWSLVGERYKEGGTHFARAGLRYLAGGDWSVDLSRSHRIAGPGSGAWTLGATWTFDRP